MAGLASRGRVWFVAVRHGRRGRDWTGTVRRGGVWQDWRGEAWIGLVRCGEVGHGSILKGRCNARNR